MKAVSHASQALPRSPLKGETRIGHWGHNYTRHMKRVGSGQRLVAVVLAAVMLVPSFGTSWTVRQPSLHSTVIDPSLSAGEVALVQTTAGHAGALSLLLTDLGATEVQAEPAVDMVIARLSPAALAALKTDARVTLATSDTRIVMSEDDPGDTDLDSVGNPNPADSAGASAINAPLAWPRATGQGVTVALMDSGIAEHPDIAGKVKTRVNFVNDGSLLLDPAGHGTHIAGIIAANGEMKGVAPDARLVSIRVLDAYGYGQLSSVVKGFGWLLRNKNLQTIDVLNISWGAPQATTYHKDLLSALVESAWFGGITVVVAAGNGGAGALAVTAPAADPFVVTVGSFDDQGTADQADDLESVFSSRGATLDGFAKPDVLAPGRHVVSLRASGAYNALSKPGNLRAKRLLTAPEYIRMSGTSAAAGFVSGVAALVESVHHGYSPTQVKGAIVASGRAVTGASAPAVDAAAALDAMQVVNAGLAPSKLLLFMLSRSGVRLHGVTWEGVTWEGVTWDGVTWDGVIWNGVTWENVSWDSVSWETVSWETVSWETVTWEGVVWEKVSAK
jgi:subtilisin family serine protease